MYMHVGPTSGLCSNALAFANANSTFDSVAIVLVFDSKTLYYCCCPIMFIFLVGFVWNKHQKDQYKNLCLQCLNVTVHTKSEANACVNGLLV